MSEDKGQWAEVADEGIAPTDDDDGTTGRTTGDDTPATAEGIDLSAGDDADATTDGHADPTPDGVEPDVRDATKPRG